MKPNLHDFWVPALYQRWLQNGAMASGPITIFHQPRFCWNRPVISPKPSATFWGWFLRHPLKPHGYCEVGPPSYLGPSFIQGSSLRYPSKVSQLVAKIKELLQLGPWVDPPSHEAFGSDDFTCRFWVYFFGFPAFGFLGEGYIFNRFRFPTASQNLKSLFDYKKETWVTLFLRSRSSTCIFWVFHADVLFFLGMETDPRNLDLRYFRWQSWKKNKMINLRAVWTDCAEVYLRNRRTSCCFLLCLARKISRLVVKHLFCWDFPNEDRRCIERVTVVLLLQKLLSASRSSTMSA